MRNALDLDLAPALALALALDIFSTASNTLALVLNVD